MLAAALDWRREGPPQPLLRGDELPPSSASPRDRGLGDLLAELEAAQYAGEVEHPRRGPAVGAGAARIVCVDLDHADEERRWLNR